MKLLRTRLAMLITCILATIPSYGFYVDGVDYKEIPGTNKVQVRGFMNGYEPKTLIIPEDVKDADGTVHRVCGIASAAFFKCTFLQSVTIPSSVTSIGTKAFSGCESLTSITIPETVTSIEAEAFSECKSLKSMILPESLTNIESKLFYNCNYLTSITIPKTVTSIGSEAFAWCRSLASVSLPESLTKIQNRAFYYCMSLKSIIIPKSVVEIQKEAFCYCSLRSITFEGTKPGVDYYGDVFSINPIREINFPEEAFISGDVSFRVRASGVLNDFKVQNKTVTTAKVTVGDINLKINGEKINVVYCQGQEIKENSKKTLIGLRPECPLGWICVRLVDGKRTGTFEIYESQIKTLELFQSISLRTEGCNKIHASVATNLQQDVDLEMTDMFFFAG